MNPLRSLVQHGLRPLPEDARYDAIIVLGCRVMPDGRPSTALARRTRHGVELFEAGRAPQLVLTGGMEANTPIAQADAAAALALELGVPEAALVRENRSTSTDENARFAAELTDAKTVLVVSDAYHILRAERVFARYFDTVRGIGTRCPQAWPHLREVGALTLYALTGKLSRRGGGRGSRGAGSG